MPSISASFHEDVVWKSFGNHNEKQETDKRFFKSKALLKLHAKELGIDMAGKDDETLAKEIYEAMVLQAAKKLDIESRG
ncbi:hypothetical protein R0K20_25155, partial [Staphylococcus sp. SIMBA_130]